MKPKPFHSKLTLLVLMLAGAIAGLLHFNAFQVGQYTDDAHYIILAESLAGGFGFRLINYPNAPIEIAFPFGWPLLLAPLTALFPGNYEVLKLLAFVFWVASIPLMYRIFRTRLASPYLELLIGLIVLTPQLAGISGMVMSEASYLFFSLLTLSLADLWDQKRGRLHGAVYWLILLAVTATAVYTEMIRTIGLSMLLALIAYLLLSRRWRETVISGGMMAILLLPQMWLNSSRGGSVVPAEYTDLTLNASLVEKMMQMWANLQVYAGGMVTTLLIPLFGPNLTDSFQRLGLGIVPFLFNGLLIMLVVVGVVLSLADFRLGVLYVGCYFLAILTYWSPSVFGSTHTRFLLPIVPFLYFFLVRGILWSLRLVTAGNERRSFVAFASIAALILAILLIRNVQDLVYPIRNRIVDLSPGSTWLAQYAPPQAVVMTKDPAPRYLYAHRQTVGYPSAGYDIRQYLRATKVGYILISGRSLAAVDDKKHAAAESQLRSLLRANPEEFEIVYSDETNQVIVYEVHDTPPTGTDPSSDGNN